MVSGQFLILALASTLGVRAQPRPLASGLEQLGKELGTPINYEARTPTSSCKGSGGCTQIRLT